MVNLHKARPIQWRRIVDAAHMENMRRARDFEDALGELKLDASTIKSAIRNARDEDELHKVWPDELRRAV